MVADTIPTGAPKVVVRTPRVIPGAVKTLLRFMRELIRMCLRPATMLTLTPIGENVENSRVCTKPLRATPVLGSWVNSG